MTLARAINLKPLGKKIYLHLQKRGSISPLEAFSTYGTMRLAAQIHDLREAGLVVETVMKTDEEGKEYARYYLREQQLAA
jgi:hypothetical protein